MLLNKEWASYNTVYSGLRECKDHNTL